MRVGGRFCEGDRRRSTFALRWTALAWLANRFNGLSTASYGLSTASYGLPTVAHAQLGKRERRLVDLTGIEPVTS